MEPHTFTLMQALLGLPLGAAIGLLFAAIQQAALRRHEKRQEQGRFRNGWTLVPGSVTRVALLLVALVGVQIFYPALFTGPGKWWVSAGVAGGYGAALVWQLWLWLRRDT